MHPADAGANALPDDNYFLPLGDAEDEDGMEGTTDDVVGDAGTGDATGGEVQDGVDPTGNAKAPLPEVPELPFPEAPAPLLPHHGYNLSPCLA